MGDQVIEVLCYAGIEYAERPLALLWQGKEIKVIQVLSAGITPDGKTFMVLLENGWQLNLRYQQSTQSWHTQDLPEAT